MNSIKDLAAEVNIPIVEDLMAGAAGNAVTMKIRKMGIAPSELHPWYTYWLIIILDENIGAGIGRFQG